jgi:hypothetical protein
VVLTVRYVVDHYRSIPATQFSTRNSGVSAIGRIGAQSMQGSLTVRQSVLERVDAVENDDTWKGDFVRTHIYGRAARLEVKWKAVVHPTLAHEGKWEV